MTLIEKLSMCFALALGNSFGSALSDLATSMKPGSWAELKTEGLVDSLLQTDPSGYGQPIVAYGNNAAWDPGSQKFLFLGSPHYKPYRFVLFDAAKNGWNVGPLPFPANTLIHSYDHNTIDPATGDMYHRQYGSRSIFKFSTRGDNTWSALPEIPQDVLEGTECCSALGFFPEMGGLVFVDAWGVVFFNVSTKKWSRLANVNAKGPTDLPTLPMGDYCNNIAYDPIHKCMLFGGGLGNTNLYKLDATGKITQQKSSPVGYGVARTVHTIDPVTGRWLLFGPSDNKFVYEYDVVQDTWRQLSGVNPPCPTVSTSYDESVVTPVSNYGVIMFLSSEGSKGKVFLYKHSESLPTAVTPGECKSCLAPLNGNKWYGGAAPFDVNGRAQLSQTRTTTPLFFKGEAATSTMILR